LTKMRSALKRHPAQRNYLTAGLQVETGRCPCVYEVRVGCTRIPGFLFRLSPNRCACRSALMQGTEHVYESVRTESGLQIEQVQRHVRDDSQISGISTKPPLPV
jgi:hypothetical protein